MVMIHERRMKRSMGESGEKQGEDDEGKGW